MKILALGPNSTKFYTHNLWATRRLEMEKLDADGECNGEVMGVVVQEARGGCVVGCGGGVGGPGGVAPWLARGPPKAGLAASKYIYIYI